jgi:hypothetical protein
MDLILPRFRNLKEVHLQKSLESGYFASFAIDCSYRDPEAARARLQLRFRDTAEKRNASSAEVPDIVELTPAVLGMLFASENLSQVVF